MQIYIKRCALRDKVEQNYLGRWIKQPPRWAGVTEKCFMRNR